MLLLVRKIERAKWERRKSDELKDTPADAITRCMRTSEDKLSVWRIDTEDEFPDAVLAIVATAEHLETMHFVMLCGEELHARGLQTECSPSGPPVRGMEDRHYDIVDLTYSTLGEVASIILRIVKENRVERRTKRELRELLISAVEQGRLARIDLKERLRGKLFPERES